MAAASVTISCERGDIRRYGGNRLDVRGVAHRYRTMDRATFLATHPYLQSSDFDTLSISTRFNKS